MKDNRFERVLIATDGSKGALAATRIGAEVAAANASEVILVHAAATPPIMTGAGEPPDDVVEYFNQAAERSIRASREVLEQFGLECEPIAVFRTPAADAILKVARERDVDLIVIGHRDLGALGRFFLGSVSNRIAHEAHRAVLLAPPMDHV